MEILQNIVCNNCQHIHKVMDRYVPNDFHGTISNSIRLQTCNNCGHSQLNFETIVRGTEKKEEEVPQLEFPGEEENEPDTGKHPKTGSKK